jgi:hypothetical protein
MVTTRQEGEEERGGKTAFLLLPTVSVPMALVVPLLTSVAVMIRIGMNMIGRVATLSFVVFATLFLAGTRVLVFYLIRRCLKLFNRARMATTCSTSLRFFTVTLL